MKSDRHVEHGRRGAGRGDAASTLHLGDAPLDAEVLLGHVIGHDRTWLLAHPEAPLSEADAFGAAIARRAQGEPVAYIRGFKEWRSLRIRTDARALIPRPETELVVEAAAAEIRARGTRAVVWDLATGSAPSPWRSRSTSPMHWPTAGSGSSPATPLQPLSSWRPRTSRRTAWPRPSSSSRLTCWPRPASRCPDPTS